MQVNVQVGVFEMLEKIKACLAQLEGRMASGFQRIQERLDSFEKAPDSPSIALDRVTGTGCVASTGHDLKPSSNGLMMTNSDVKEINIPCRQPAEECAVSLTPVVQNGCRQSVSIELIRSCVSPTKIGRVQQTLERESERHLCALKLLACLFSREELAISNTDGSYDKKCLDSERLNSLKVLLFTKFPASSIAEREKEWKAIKGKINTKCRSAKHLSKNVALIDTYKDALS